MRFNRCLVNFFLSLVRNENHDHVRGLGCLFDGGHGKPIFLCPSRRRAALVRRYTDVDTTVTHVQSVGVSLTAIADYRNPPGFDQARISVFFVIDVGHEISLSVTSTEMTSICLCNCLTICSARAGLQCAVMVMRERPGSESGTTIKHSMLYPRELN